MSYKKCPTCSGTGLNHDVVIFNKSVKCYTCNGTLIISELTGLPPKDKQYYNDEWNQGDIRE